MSNKSLQFLFDAFQKNVARKIYSFSIYLKRFCYIRDFIS